MATQNRREFIATSMALAATAAVPVKVATASVVTVPTVPASINWLAFCVDEPIRRYCINTPFVRNGFMYATDSRIIIRQPTKRPETKKIEGHPPFPKPEKLPWWEQEGEWLAWPERTQAVEAEWCPQCGGEGRVGYIKDCPKCHGDGAIYGEYIDDFDDPEKIADCHTCHKTGVIYRSKCPYCDGKGKGFLVWRQLIGDSLICAYHDQRIRSLPGPIGYLPPATASDAIRFRFAGGEGLVMPLSYSKEEVEEFRESLIHPSPQPVSLSHERVLEDGGPKGEGLLTHH